MKRSTKAAALSGLICPGLGHLYLRQYAQGTLLVLGAFLAIYFIASPIIHIALAVAGKIQTGEVAFDVTAISDLVSRQSRDTAQSTNIATIVLIGIWIIGIIDSYRLGRAQEHAIEPTGEKKT